MRGGVTVKAQDLQRLNPDVIGEISEMHPLLTKKLTNTTLRYAVKYYCSNWYSKMAMIRKGHLQNYGSKETKRRSSHVFSFKYRPRRTTSVARFP